MGSNADASSDVDRNFRWLGWAVTVPMLSMIFVVAYAPFPYPDDNVNGQEALDYGLPGHVVEWETLTWIPLLVVICGFLMNLALAYWRQAGRARIGILLIISAPLVFAAMSMVALGMYSTISLFARGYVDYQGDRNDLAMVAVLFTMMQTIFTMANAVMGVAFLAVFAVDRTYPVLPRPVAWSALLIGLINIAELASLFIPTGPWSPGSWATFMPAMFLTTGWLIAARLLMSRHRTSGAAHARLPEPAIALDAVPGQMSRSGNS